MATGRTGTQIYLEDADGNKTYLEGDLRTTWQPTFMGTLQAISEEEQDALVKIVNERFARITNEQFRASFYGSFGSDVPSSWCTPSRRPMTEYHPSEIIEEDSQAIPIEEDSVFVPQREKVHVEA